MRKIIIYGTGKVGKEYVDKCVCGGVSDITLVDSNSKLWGIEYQGLTIANPDEISWQEYAFVVVTTEDETCAEITNQLVSKYKIPREKIYSHSQTVVLTENEAYNLGDMKLREAVVGGRIVTAEEFKQLLDKESLNDLGKFFFFNEHKMMTKWMHYFEAYDRFFSKYRGKDVKILEIGVWRGGSMQMWKNYFKTSDNNVQIYGIDIDPACKAYEEDGIKIFIGSQEDREFLNKVKKEIGKIDVLIDDGGHTMNQQIVSLEELFDCVADDGIYLCEDLHTSYWQEYGGGYGSENFINYSKNIIDDINAQYSRTEKLVRNKYSDCVRYITYCDSMMFIEKRPRCTRSFDCTI